VTGAPETFLDGRVTLHSGDCLEVLAGLPEGSIDACVTDPPYHFASIVKRFGAADAAPAKAGTAGHHTGAYARASRGFMGKEWDGGDIAFRPETWAAVYRVLKPGAHLVAFAAPKNVHHMAVAIEAAGFEMRDRFLRLMAADAAVTRFVASLSEAQADAFWRCVDDSGFTGELAWIFGSGFPKSHAVALDFERSLCRREKRGGRSVWVYVSDGAEMRGKAPWRHPLANEWAGWGTALKPAYEPIVLARKPLAGTVAATVERHGTGAVNVGGCAISCDESTARVSGVNRGVFGSDDRQGMIRGGNEGRFPAGLMHDGSADVLEAFPQTSSGKPGIKRRGNNGHAYGAESRPPGTPMSGFGDAGSAARFFYADKADDGDRLGSKHPTVKPLDLMQWLVRLVTPPGGTVLDLFAGTGTTGEAAFREGFSAVLIEREADYQADIRRRMGLCLAGPDERRRETVKAKGAVPAPEGLFAWVGQE
jgi:site-specific DNA-methyltransferase (adenine-specific)